MLSCSNDLVENSGNNSDRQAVLPIEVDLALKEPGEIESVRIPQDAIALNRDEQTKKIAVKEDAGL